MSSRFSVIIVISLFALSQSKLACTHYPDELSCNAAQECTFINGGCTCTSDTKLDIIFGYDTSGSVTFTGHLAQKQFIRDLVATGLSEISRVGFIPFSTDVNISRSIQSWPSKTDLTDYVDGLFFAAGWTNTSGLLTAAMTEFENTFETDRHQILVMVTDGNPCLPTGCPFSVCDANPYDFGRQYDEKGIITVLIDIGEGLNKTYVDCLYENRGGEFNVPAFNSTYFDSILDGLSDYLCPITPTSDPTSDPTTDPTRAPLEVGETSEPTSLSPTISPTGVTDGPTPSDPNDPSLSGSKRQFGHQGIILSIVVHLILVFV